MKVNGRELTNDEMDRRFHDEVERFLAVLCHHDVGDADIGERRPDQQTARLLIIGDENFES